MVNRVFIVFTTDNGLIKRGVLDHDHIVLGSKVYSIEKLFEHKEGRHPSLGWTDLTVIEAKVDGAHQCIARKNYTGAYDRLSDVLAFSRRLIERRKKQGATLEKRCQVKDWERSKCGKYPAEEFNGKYYCKKHLKGVLEFA